MSPPTSATLPQGIARAKPPAQDGTLLTPT